MSRTQGVGTVWVLTELSLVSLHTDTLAILTVSMSATVRNLTFLIADVTLLPLPSWPTDTLSVAVLSLSRTEKRTNTLGAELSIVPRVTLTLSHDTVSMSVTSVLTSLRHLRTPPHLQLDVMTRSVIVVHGDEPVTGVQEEILHSCHRALEIVFFVGILFYKFHCAQE